MISIINYGMGNVGSIQNMFRKIGFEANILSDPSLLSASDKLILPGVGRFDNGVKKLIETGFYDALKDAVQNKRKSLLGICLGMHLLFDGSEEGDGQGFGFVPGLIKKFNFQKTEYELLKIPHMGWNSVNARKPVGIFENYSLSRYYFVHSYYPECNNPEHILGTSLYGHEFTCSVNNRNIWGVQFHPEKSHRFGLNLLKNFVEFC